MRSRSQAIGRLARVEDKPDTEWEDPVQETMASKCPKCEKTVYFGKFVFTFRFNSEPLLKMHSPLYFDMINDFHGKRWFVYTGVDKTDWNIWEFVIDRKINLSADNHSLSGIHLYFLVHSPLSKLPKIISSPC